MLQINLLMQKCHKRASARQRIFALDKNRRFVYEKGSEMSSEKAVYRGLGATPKKPL